MRKILEELCAQFESARIMCAIYPIMAAGDSRRLT